MPRRKRKLYAVCIPVNIAELNDEGEVMLPATSEQHTITLEVEAYSQHAAAERVARRLNFLLH